MEIPERVICDFCCGGWRGGWSLGVEFQAFLREVYAAVAGLLSRLEEGSELGEELRVSALAIVSGGRIYLFISEMSPCHCRDLPISVEYRLSWECLELSVR